MPFAKIDELQMHYDVRGNHDAPALVLSHSLGADNAMWAPQTSELQKQFRVVSYDTRGHGKSSVKPAPYTLEQLGRDVIGLLDQLQIEKAHFCGLSLGGAIGMWLGANVPARLHKLVLCNTAAKLGTQESWNTRIDIVHAGGMKSVATGIIGRWFTAKFRENHKEIVQKTQQTIEETNVDGYVGCCAALRDMDQRETISTIQVPTLVVVGAYDPVATPSDGRFLVEKISGAKYVELNAAHLSNIEDAQHFNAEVGRFLTS